MKNRIIYKIVLIIIDIIAVVGLIFLYNIWKENKRILDDEVVKYKKFHITIPNNIYYEVIDDYKFRLKDDKYEAIVEIFIDDETNMINYPDIFYNDLLKNNMKVEKQKIYKVDNQNIITYKLHDNVDSILCYMKSNIEGFAYEVNLYYNNGEFNESIFRNIKDILMNVTYDYQSEEVFDYYKWTFEEEVAELNNL